MQLINCHIKPLYWDIHKNENNETVLTTHTAIGEITVTSINKKWHIRKKQGLLMICPSRKKAQEWAQYAHNQKILSFLSI